MALASICTSTGATAGGGQAAPAPPVADRSAPLAEQVAELELALAGSGDVYLVLRPDARTLDVKVAGLTVQHLALDGVALLQYRSYLGAEPPTIELPVVLSVVEGLDAPLRRVVTAEQLSPYPGEDVQVDTAPPAPEPAAEPPDAYAVRLEGGWTLRLGQRLPPTGLLSRLALTFDDLRTRLRGLEPEPRGVLGLALPAEDARRLHHLFRPGLAILVAAAPSP